MQKNATVLSCRIIYTSNTYRNERLLPSIVSGSYFPRTPFSRNVTCPTIGDVVSIVTLSDGERTAYKSKLREESAKRTAASKAASLKRAEESRARSEVKKFDRNKDGKLDAQESAALNKYRDVKKARLKEYYDKYDANGDGTVSVEEKKAYVQRLKEQKGNKGKGERKKGERKPKPPKIKKKHSKKDR